MAESTTRSGSARERGLRLRHEYNPWHVVNTRDGYIRVSEGVYGFDLHDIINNLECIAHRGGFGALVALCEHWHAYIRAALVHQNVYNQAAGLA